MINSTHSFPFRSESPSRWRFHKIVWSPLGINSTQSHGVIAAGCEGGHLQLYSAGKLFAGEEALIAVQDKHTGAVRALDYNPFQTNLLASGASESDILIWDLNNTTTPMTPGTKTQPLEDIQNIAWNRQVQHILASVFSTRCVVWDLRKNEPIIKLSDSQSRVRFRAMQWHPNIATQLWLASEDDLAPVVQLWDLRYATAPAKVIWWRTFVWRVCCVCSYLQYLFSIQTDIANSSTWNIRTYVVSTGHRSDGFVWQRQ